MDAERLAAIRERVASHELVYERPDHGAPCWPEYRRSGVCGCRAEADVEALLDLIDELLRDPPS